MGGQSPPAGFPAFDMNRLLLISVAVLVVIVLGGGVFLMLWDIPAPTARVEKVIPDARFPR